MHRSALRLHSRDHDSSIRVACRSRAPCQDGGGPLRFYAQPLAPMSCRDSVEALALAITAGRYRPHLARSPHEVNLLGALSFFVPARSPASPTHPPPSAIQSGRCREGSSYDTDYAVMPDPFRHRLTQFPPASPHGSLRFCIFRTND